MQKLSTAGGSQNMSITQTYSNQMQVVEAHVLLPRNPNCSKCALLSRLMNIMEMPEWCKSPKNFEWAFEKAEKFVHHECNKSIIRAKNPIL